MKNPQAIMLVYGEGGHEAQMKRLLAALPGIEESGLAKIAYAEGSATEFGTFEQLARCEPLRDKHHRFSALKAILSVWKNILLFHELLRNWDVKVLITTGPGVALSAAVLARLHGIKVIHIETWCRFYSKSFTGRLMYRLANHFYVQNKELLVLYPKAVWCGRL
ncbi:MAG: PssD/Cps14F family polysaccharide biosynthesis glycosyltransferase [Aestuariibacter sp.]